MKKSNRVPAIVNLKSSVGNAPSSRRAFTLVEVMVVVSILGIIAAFIFPSISRAIRYKENAEIAQKIGAVSLAFELYEAENGEWPKQTGAGSLPPEMVDYYFPLYGIFDEDDGIWWIDDPLFEGKWKWRVDSKLLDDRVVILELHSATAFDPVRMTELDRLLDDGDLATGRFRKYTSTDSYAYIVGEDY